RSAGRRARPQASRRGYCGPGSAGAFATSSTLREWPCEYGAKLYEQSRPRRSPVRHTDHRRGHNGLVCAAYLAAAGLKITVLERRAVVGGAAVTEEFHPGFRNSVAAYAVSLLN